MTAASNNAIQAQAPQYSVTYLQNSELGKFHSKKTCQIKLWTGLGISFSAFPPRPDFFLLNTSIRLYFKTVTVLSIALFQNDSKNQRNYVTSKVNFWF